MITITVTGEINVSGEIAYEILNNCEEYSQWWTVPVKYSSSSEIRFNPIPFITIGLEKEKTDKRGIIRFKYKEGPLRGIGIWNIQSIAEGRCKVSYTTVFIPVSMLVDAVCTSVAFKRKHTKDILEIIAKIEEYAKR